MHFRSIAAALRHLHSPEAGSLTQIKHTQIPQVASLMPRGTAGCSHMRSLLKLRKQLKFCRGWGGVDSGSDGDSDKCH